jgi:hypothetical protein
MGTSLKATAASLLRATAWLFLGVGLLAFWAAGAVISAIAGTDRVLAEMEGIALTLLCLVLAGGAKYVADRLEEGDGPASLGEALRENSPAPQVSGNPVSRPERSLFR